MTTKVVIHLKMIPINKVEIAYPTMEELNFEKTIVAPKVEKSHGCTNSQNNASYASGLSLPHIRKHMYP